MGYAYIFPGQGSQQVGMGKDIWKHAPVAREVFAEANDALGFDLTSLCFTGPQTQLTATECAQPAILTTSIAIGQVLREQGIVPSIVAGHSVGSFAALVTAGCLPFADALRLVRQRGLLMAAVRQRGSMLAVVSSSETRLRELEELASQHYALDVAGYNSPGQTVFSGTIEAIQQFQEAVSALSGAQAKPFAVSHAFHSRLMEEQKAAWAAVLADQEIVQARIPVGLNVSGKYTTEVEAIREDLVEQFTRPVQWRKLFQHLLERHLEMLLEVGMGRTLAGLARAWSEKPAVQGTENVMALTRIARMLQEERSIAA